MGCGGEGGNGDDVSLWVALAVVQSYNPRCKVPRGDISIPHLETCLAKVSYSAAQNSGSFSLYRKAAILFSFKD